jgi:hypothetical protein
MSDSSWNPPPDPYGQQPYGQQPYGAMRRTEGLAVASLVLGIAGFVVCPLICSVLAIIFGLQAKTKIRQDPSLQGEGMAQAGFILGIIGLAVGAIVLIIVIIAAANSDSSSSSLGAVAQLLAA